MIQSRDSPGNLNQSRWGNNLDSLLDDSDGVEFFNKFLSYQHSASHLLDFWFACKGFRSNVDLSNPEKLFQVAKVIYRTYIKSGASHAVPLPYVLKQNINDCLSSYHDGYKKSFNSDGSILPPDRCMFDPAQNVIKDLLEQKYYPEFLTFISCPANLQNLSSGEQVCREREVRNKYLEILYPEQTSDGFEDVLSKQKSLSLGSKLPTDQLTNDTSQHSCNNKVDVPCEKHDNYDNKPQITHQSHLLNMLPSHDTNHTAQPSSTSMQTACHPNHVNISTGGLLVHGNHCNNASKESSHPNKLHHPVRKQTNLAESDPTLFVQLLTERLEKVKESRGKVEKLMSLVNQVDEKHSVESGHSSVPLKDTKEYNRSLQLNNSTWCQQDATNSSINPSANEVNFTSAHIIHSSTTDDSKRLNYPHESVFHKNRRHTDKSQDAQEILDDHCSRIWADELGDSTINASKTHYRRQQSDCSRNTTSRSSTTPYPIISDTLVHSMHSSLVRGGSSATEYEMKRLSEQYRTTTASYSSANSNNNINSNQPSMSDSSHRRWHTAGSYRGMNRLNKSDVRSTASWDSGVVTSYEMKSLNLNNNADDNDYLDAETSSILEAASVQALSSSTTELALVNGEVTAKLVEKMIRHYPHKTFDRDSRHNGNMLPLFNSSQRKKETINPGYEYKYRLERKWQQQQQQSGHFYESPYVQGFNPNSSLCSACQHSADRVPCDWHHCFHYPSTHSTSNEHSSPHLMVTSCGCNQSSDKSILGSSCRSFPTASDTSSTFDSGISSAYDQLPLQKHTNNRENRSQSLHNWQMNVNLKDTNLSTPRGNRTHSASKSSCDSNNTSRSINYPPANCLISSCYEFNSNQLPGHYMQNDLCPTRHHHCPEMMMIKDVNKHDGNECKKPSSGKLLQHWLQLQQQHPSEKSHCPANDGQGKALSDNTIPGDHLRSHINKACKESHERKTHHHGHNHRKSSAQRTNSNHNSSPKYSLSNNNNMELSSCQHHSDDDDNKTNSVHMDSRLTSSTATNTQQQTSNVNSSGPGLVVGYYLCDDPVPYRTVWTGPTTAAAHTNQTSSASSAVLVEVNDQSQTVDNCQTNSTGQPLLTLGQFKQLIAKKGVYRYFFKKPNDEFGTGVVHEELTNDDATLPLWEGKVVARVERAD